jgi:hypothetical protein
LLEKKRQDLTEKEATLTKWSDSISKCEHNLRYVATKAIGTQPPQHSAEFFAVLEKSYDRVVNRLTAAETNLEEADRRCNDLADDLKKERSQNAGY